MLQWLIHRIRSTRRRGAVAIEFGLIGPALVVLIFMTLDVVYAMTARGVAEAALDNASRFSQTGAGGNNMAARTISYTNKLYSLTDSMLDNADLALTLDSYSSVNGMWTNDTGVGGSGFDASVPPKQIYSPDLGQTGWFTVYTLSYNHRMLSGGVLCALLPSGTCDGVLPMSFRIVRQNEPF